MQVLQFIVQWWYQMGTIVKQIITSTNDTKLFQSKGITKLLKKKKPYEQLHNLHLRVARNKFMNKQLLCLSRWWKILFHG
jgi:hypothetical protein